jgi:recombinational DNA repair protein RecT
MPPTELEKEWFEHYADVFSQGTHTPHWDQMAKPTWIVNKAVQHCPLELQVRWALLKYTQDTGLVVEILETASRDT